LVRQNGNNNNSKKRAESPLRNAESPLQRYRYEASPGTNRAVSLSLMLSILFALVLGIFGAIYFDQFRGDQAANSPPAAADGSAQNTVSTPALPGPDQNIAAANIPPLSRINPTAGRANPAPLQAAQSGYWVEYGAYSGPGYADQLVKRLDTMGLKAYVVMAPGVGGKQYYRVRSATGGERAAAAAASLKVSDALDIAPIVHRDGKTQMSAAAFTPPIPSLPGSTLTYWVQFGAYDIESYAMLYAGKLRDSGLDVTVIARQRPSGRVIYLVRSHPLSTSDEAQDLARRSQQLVGADTLVGQTIPEAPATRHL
jgi:cell division protein FtsN